MFNLSTPHGDKLTALLSNNKLPSIDKISIQNATERYKKWKKDLDDVNSDIKILVNQMVALLNAYKRYIDVDIIFDSRENFLYRQKGQLKLDNSIIEEFLPILVTKFFSESLKNQELYFGPKQCFSSLQFESALHSISKGGGMSIRKKDQDFAISRKIFIQTSHYQDFRDSLSELTYIAYIAAECKTNLDKTMFQEGAATAQDIKSSVPGAKYFLICEWLDMSPISSSLTAIDEILILRKAKRLSSNIRGNFSTVTGRVENRQTFIQHLDDNPFAPDVFMRLLKAIEQMIQDGQLDENNVLTKGYF